MGPLDSWNAWIEKGDENVESFVTFVQIFSGNTVTKLKSTALVACPVHTFSWMSRLEEVNRR